MGTVLIDCTKGLPARKYGACDQLNKKYPEWLSKHVDVNRKIKSKSNGNSGENQGNGTESNSSASFKHAKKNQQQFVSTVKKFNQTRKKYQQAHGNGSTQKARARGRKLLGLARQARNVSTNLTANYRTIGTVSGTNVTGGITTINNTTENISAIARNISAEQFVNTTMRINASPRRISYLRPLSVTGRLTDENGTSLSNQRIVLRAGNYTRKTTTTDSGEFSFTYRPTLVSLDTRHVTIQYIPKDLSPYLRNETTVPVSIKQVQPTINVSTAPNRVRFGNLVSVSGRVKTDGPPVSSIPIAVSVNGQRLSSVRDSRTNSQGMFQVSGRLPADVPTGRQTVRVSLPLEGRALAGTTTNDTITVLSTPTTLSVHAPEEYRINRSNSTERVIPVTGRLSTKDGTAISDRTVELRLAGTNVGRVQTGPNGTYAANVSIPPQVITGLDGATPVTLVAVYSGQETSFSKSRARTRITIIPPERGFLERLLNAFEELSVVYQFLAGVVLVLLAGFLVYALRRRYVSVNAGNQSDVVSEQESTNSDDEDGSEISLIEVARRQLTAGDTDRAILTAYAVIRTRLTDVLGLTSTQTHREFLAACRDRTIGNTQFNLLGRLTEAYEQAAFASQTTSEKTATESVENAQFIEDEAASDNSQSDEN